MNARRRRTARLAAIGSASVALAAALVVGVGVPANAADLNTAARYQLTAPGSVSAPWTTNPNWNAPGGVMSPYYPNAQERAAQLALAQRSLDSQIADRNAYVSGMRSPFSRIGGSVSLLGAAASMTTIHSSGMDAPTSYMHGQNEWDRSGPKPDHIPQQEWDTCARDVSNLAGSIFNGFRDWQASVEGTWGGGSGTDCNAVRAGWGVPIPADYEPIGSESLPGFPLQVSSASITLTLGSPVFNADPAQGSNSVWGWLYPIHVTGNLAGYSTVWFRPTAEYVNEAGATIAGQHTPNIYSLKGTPPTTVGNVGQTVLPASMCGAAGAFGCVQAGFGREAATRAQAILDGGMPVLSKIELQTNVGTSPQITTETVNKSLPYAPIRLGEAPPPTSQREEVVLISTITDTNGNTYSCETRTFREVAGGAAPMPCEPTVPAGMIEDKRIVEVVPAAEAGTYQPGSQPGRKIVETATEPGYRQWREEFPQCKGGECVLDLVDTRTGVSCFEQSMGDTCNGWSVQPDKETRYRCTYAGKTLSLNECLVYAPTFAQQNRDAGQAYQPAPGQKPGEQTSTPPAQSIAPGTAVQNPTQPRNCWPTGWGVFNPAEWIQRPVQCVMEWAFVPREEVTLGTAQAMQAAWAGSSLGQLLSVIGNGTALVLEANGCSGPTVTLQVAEDLTYSGQPLNACDSPGKELATASNLFTFISAWVMAIVSINRSVSGVFAMSSIGGDEK
jgi:hypothetical protein